MSAATIRKWCGVGAMLVVVAILAVSNTGEVGSGKKIPLLLTKQGSFFVGGEIEFRSPNSTTANDPKFVPGDIAVDQMYVQYQAGFPQEYRYPLVLVHGGGHTGKAFESTPDKREGWFTSFTRRGFPTFVVDAPNRGRTGYDPTKRYKVYQGLSAPTALEVGDIYSAQAAWVSFRWGATYGVPNADLQFPIAYVDDYLMQLVPSYRGSGENPQIVQDLVALLDKLGPSILLGWSTGTFCVMGAACERPELVKGIIGIEGVPSTSAVDMPALATIPVVILVGDYTSPDATQDFTDELEGLGGDATTIWLPDIGLYGNSHTMVMELNSEQVADVIDQWIVEHVPDLLGRYMRLGTL